MLYEHYSDTELFALIRQEDIKAFEELYNRHWSFLVDTAFKRLQSRERAEDLVQDLFISLYQKRQVVEFTVSLQAYLGTALKYKILNEFRSENTRTNYKKSLFFKEVCKNDLANQVEARDLNQKVDKILDTLPDKCKKVFLLSRRENQTNKDISRYLDISLSTVEKHIGKALKILRTSLPEYRNIGLRV